MMPQQPSSNMLMFQAVFFWIIAFWCVEIANQDPVGLGAAVVCAFVAMGLAIGSVSKTVRRQAPFPSLFGHVAWCLRPRKWMLGWALIVGLVLVFGRPMVLTTYGSEHCQYIDWWFKRHVLSNQGDGVFSGCRFLSSW